MEEMLKEVLKTNANIFLLDRKNDGKSNASFSFTNCVNVLYNHRDEFN